MGTKAGSETRKGVVMNAIKRAFKSKAATIVLYYSGHGWNGTGDWCFEDKHGNVTEKITFEDVLKEWRALRKFEQHLCICIDACYSGVWAEKSSVLLDDSEWGMTIQTSCDSSQISMDSKDGGAFTSALVSFHIRGHKYSPIEMPPIPFFDGNLDGHLFHTPLANGQKPRLG